MAKAVQNSRSGRPLSSVECSMRMLACFSSGEELCLDELAARLAASRVTTRRIAGVLTDACLLTLNEATGTYALGPGLLELPLQGQPAGDDAVFSAATHVQPAQMPLKLVDSPSDPANESAAPPKPSRVRRARPRPPRLSLVR